MSYAALGGHADVLRLLLASRAEAQHGARPPLEALAATEEVRRLLRRPAPTWAPRRRQVAYGAQDVLDIAWHRHGKALLVRSLGPKDKAKQLGVRPGWSLRRVNGLEATAVPREVPVDLEFQRAGAEIGLQDALLGPIFIHFHHFHAFSFSDEALSTCPPTSGRGIWRRCWMRGDKAAHGVNCGMAQADFTST